MSLTDHNVEAVFISRMSWVEADTETDRSGKVGHQFLLGQRRVYIIFLEAEGHEMLPEH